MPCRCGIWLRPVLEHYRSFPEHMSLVADSFTFSWKLLLVATALILLSPCVFATPEEDRTLERLEARLEEMIEEETSAKAQMKALEEVLRERELEHVKLRATASALDEQLAALVVPGADPKGAPAVEESPKWEAHEAELVISARDRIVLLSGADGSIGAGFFGKHDGEVRVFAPAPVVSGEASVTAKRLDGSECPVGADFSCPSGVDLVALHPEEAADSLFELASGSELSEIGDRVVVVVADAQAAEVEGVSGTIRGIGPDKWELDADLGPEMNGAPVLALETGRVIGIVIPQVEGVAQDWAVGTRHEEARSFAARIDRIKEGRDLSFERFHKESAYIEKMEKQIRLAWLAHMLVEYEAGGVWEQYGERRAPAPPRSGDPGDRRRPIDPDLDERRRAELEDWRQRSERFRSEQEEYRRVLGEIRSEAAKNKGDKMISRIQQWLESYGVGRAGASADGLKDRRLAQIYHSMTQELEARSEDISSKFSPYHAKRYLQAREWRAEAVETLRQAEARLRR